MAPSILCLSCLQNQYDADNTHTLLSSAGSTRWSLAPWAASLCWPRGNMFLLSHWSLERFTSVVLSSDNQDTSQLQAHKFAAKTYTNSPNPVKGKKSWLPSETFLRCLHHSCRTCLPSSYQKATGRLVLISFFGPKFQNLPQSANKTVQGTRRHTVRFKAAQTHFSSNNPVAMIKHLNQSRPKGKRGLTWLWFQVSPSLRENHGGRTKQLVTAHPWRRRQVISLGPTCLPLCWVGFLHSDSLGLTLWIGAAHIQGGSS